jgi:hypothetical protein
MSLAKFNWLSNKILGKLQQDFLGQVELLPIEAQVAEGLDHLGREVSLYKGGVLV